MARKQRRQKRRRHDTSRKERTARLREELGALNRRDGGLDDVLARVEEVERALAHGAPLRGNPLRGVARAWGDRRTDWDSPLLAELDALAREVDRRG